MIGMTFEVPSNRLIVNLTSVPFSPLIIFTTSSISYPCTSTGSSFPCPTFTISSFAFNSPCFQQGLPVTMDTILTLPSSTFSCAPIP